MNKKPAQKSMFSVKGYLMFFLLVAGVATCAILAYTLIFDLSGGSKITTAIITLVILLALALLFTVVDILRRKYTVQRPVQRIVEATARVTAGDFDVKLQPQHAYGKYNEFDIIMENINIMTAELRKNEVLKTDFIANISHEIKTPLSLIQSYSVGLGNDKLTADTRREYSSTILAASMRLSDLISNILKLNKLENQEIFGEAVSFDLGEQLRECVLNVEDKIEEKQLTLECNIDDIKAISDPGLLELVWNNLLSNAIKFTDIGGNICVNLSLISGCAVVTVADSGCGISEEYGSRIFDKFYQGDTSHATDGNGLGLALVKRVVDILGGEIVVESKIGFGSTFTITLAAEIL